MLNRQVTIMVEVTGTLKDILSSMYPNKSAVTVELQDGTVYDFSDWDRMTGKYDEVLDFSCYEDYSAYFYSDLDEDLEDNLADEINPSLQEAFPEIVKLYVIE